MPDSPRVRILVGQLVDEANSNPQCLNAKALLARSASTQLQWTAPCYGPPDPRVEASRHVRVVQLWRGNLWMWHKFLFYQRPADAIFYPGVYWFDDLALQLRRKMGRKIPVIATMEGFAGNEARQRELSQLAGHPVFCQPVSARLLARIDRVLREADHVIAVSPFIARLGGRLYGDKFSVLPLGVDLKIFFPAATRVVTTFTVVGAGRLYENKRPGVFLDLARRFPAAAFVWYGDGELRDLLLAEAVRLGLRNVEFRRALPNRALAEEFRRADLFVLPSRAEGAPKVTQEAAACGLAVIVFGYYEAPTVVNGENGYVVWSDDELYWRVGELMKDRAMAASMGRRGAEFATRWDWNKVAPQWESRVLQVASPK